MISKCPIDLFKKVTCERLYYNMNTYLNNKNSSWLYEKILDDMVEIDKITFIKFCKMNGYDYKFLINRFWLNGKI